jgi:hypothetical protein
MGTVKPLGFTIPDVSTGQPTHVLIKRYGVGGAGLWVGASKVGRLSAQKKDLTTDDYARWQSIAQSEISPDGNWYSYNISLVDGDGWLAVRKIGSGDENEHNFMNSYNQQFFNDNRWLVFRIGLPQEETRHWRENQEMVKYKMGLMDLHTSEVDTFNNITGYTLSDNSRFLTDA